MKDNKEVVVLIGAGAIGTAITRRISKVKYILVADISAENNESAAKTLSEAGFEVSTAIIDICSRASVNELAKKATAIGSVTKLTTETTMSLATHPGGIYQLSAAATFEVKMPAAATVIGALYTFKNLSAKAFTLTGSAIFYKSEILFFTQMY